MHKLLVGAAALLLVLHGLIHLMGTAVYVRRAQIQGLPYKTTVLGGRLDLGESGVGVFGALWALPAVGFVISALGLWAGWSFTQPLLVIVTVFSLVLTLLDWQVAYAGAVFNVVILCALLLGPWIASLLAPD